MSMGGVGRGVVLTCLVSGSEMGLTIYWGGVSMGGVGRGVVPTCLVSGSEMEMSASPSSNVTS